MTSRAFWADMHKVASMACIMPPLLAEPSLRVARWAGCATTMSDMAPICWQMTTTRDPPMHPPKRTTARLLILSTVNSFFLQGVNARACSISMPLDIDSYEYRTHAIPRRSSGKINGQYRVSWPLHVYSTQILYLGLCQHIAFCPVSCKNYYFYEIKSPQT